MDNLKLPAYPFAWVEKLDKEGKSFAEVSPSQFGFTKLELASLMIAQGLQSSDDWQLADTNEKSPEIAKKTARTAVLIAKAVLEEANKNLL